MLIDPANAQSTRITYDLFEDVILAGEPGAEIVAGLETARTSLNAGKPFETLRVLRGLFALEEACGAPPMPALTA